MPPSQDEPGLICRLCSKPVHPGTAAFRAGETVVHVRCLARETGLRALDLQDRAAETLTRAGQAIAHSEALLARPEPFVLCGRVTSFDAATQLLTVGSVEVLLTDSVPHEGLALALGVSVTVAGYRVGEKRVATELTIRSNNLW